MCGSCYNRLLGELNPESRARKAEYNKRHKLENPEMYRRAADARAERARVDPEYAAVQKRKKRARGYRHLYGLSLEQVEEILGKGCALCGGTKLLRVDHDHSTGKLREALCHSCNVGLGFIERPEGWLDKALAYLRKHGSITAGR